MTDYVDRKALRDALYEADAITMKGVEIINQFPAADVAEVRHGRWLPIDDNMDAFDCSECEAIVSKRMNYCPNCGAEMKGDSTNAWFE